MTAPGGSEATSWVDVAASAAGILKQMEAIGEQAADAFANAFNSKLGQMASQAAGQSAGKRAGEAIEFGLSSVLSGLGTAIIPHFKAFEGAISAASGEAGLKAGSLMTAGVVTGITAGAGLMVSAFKNTAALVHREVGDFGKVGKEAADTLMDTFVRAAEGKAPDVMRAFSTVEDGLHASIVLPLNAVNAAVDTTVGHIPIIGSAFKTALGEASAAIGGFFGVLDEWKSLTGEFFGTLIEKGNQWQEVARTIAGQTLGNENLEQYLGIVREIAASGDLVHFRDVAEVVGELGTRLQGLSGGAGLTSEQLKELATTLAEGNELLGDVKINVDLLTAAFNDFDVASDKTSEELTTLVNIARDTGTQINTLLSDVDRVAPSLQALGYDLDTATYMMGKFNQELGGPALARLAFGLAQIAPKLEKAGFQNLKEGFQTIIDEATELEKVNFGAAVAFLQQYVGSARTAASMLDAMKRGIVSVTDLTRLMNEEGLKLHEPLDVALEATKSLGQAFESLGNQVMAAIGPVTVGLVERLTEAGDKVTAWMQTHQAEFVQFVGVVGDKLIEVGVKIGHFMSGALHVTGEVAQVMKNMVVSVMEDINNFIKNNLSYLEPLSKLPESVLKRIPGHEVIEPLTHLYEASKKVGEGLDKLQKTDLTRTFDDLAGGVDVATGALGNFQKTWDDIIGHAGDMAAVSGAFQAYFADVGQDAPKWQSALRDTGDGLMIVQKAIGQVTEHLAGKGIHIALDEVTGKIKGFTTDTEDEMSDLQRNLQEFLGPDKFAKLGGQITMQVQHLPEETVPGFQRKVGVPSELIGPDGPHMTLHLDLDAPEWQWLKDLKEQFEGHGPAGAAAPVAPGEPDYSKVPDYLKGPEDQGPGGGWLSRAWGRAKKNWPRIFGLSSYEEAMPANVALQPAAFDTPTRDILASAGIGLANRNATGDAVQLAAEFQLPTPGSPMPPEDLMGKLGVPGKYQGDVTFASPGVVLPAELQVGTTHNEKTLSELMQAIGIPSANQGTEGVTLDVSFDMSKASMSGGPGMTGMTGMTGVTGGNVNWNAIAGAESGGNWQITYGEGTADNPVSGGLQIGSQTWAGHGGLAYAPLPYMATPEQQIAVAERILADQGPGAWPVTSAQHPEWFGMTGLAGGGAASQGYKLTGHQGVTASLSYHEPSHLAPHVGLPQVGTSVWKHMQAGGPVPWLPGSVMGADSIFAALAPDEHVVTADEVNKGGGHGAIQMIRAALRAGKKLIPHQWGSAQYAASGAGDDLAGVDPEIMGATAIAHQYGLKLTAGRSGHGTHQKDGGYHDSGEAGDFSNGVGTPQEAAFATFMASNFLPEISELIHSGPGWNPNFNIYNGKFVRDMGGVPNVYDQKTLQDHLDHVHVAMRPGSSPQLEALAQGGGMGGGGLGGGGMFRTAGFGGGGLGGTGFQLVDVTGPGGGGGGGFGVPPGQAGAPGTGIHVPPPAEPMPPGLERFPQAAPGAPNAIQTPQGWFNYSFEMPPEQRAQLPGGPAGEKLIHAYDEWLNRIDKNAQQADVDAGNVSKAMQNVAIKQTRKQQADDEFNNRFEPYRQQGLSYEEAVQRGAQFLIPLHDKMIQADQDYIDAQQGVTKALNAQRQNVIQQNLAYETAPSGFGKVTPDSNAQALGAGLITGIFQELGFPDVFGKAVTQWTSWKLGMGILGFGLGVAQQRGLFGGTEGLGGMGQGFGVGATGWPAQMFQGGGPFGGGLGGPSGPAPGPGGPPATAGGGAPGAPTGPPPGFPPPDDPETGEYRAIPKEADPAWGEWELNPVTSMFRPPWLPKLPGKGPEEGGPGGDKGARKGGEAPPPLKENQRYDYPDPNTQELLEKQDDGSWKSLGTYHWDGKQWNKSGPRTPPQGPPPAKAAPPPPPQWQPPAPQTPVAPGGVAPPEIGPSQTNPFPYIFGQSQGGVRYQQGGVVDPWSGPVFNYYEHLLSAYPAPFESILAPPPLQRPSARNALGAIRSYQQGGMQQQAGAWLPESQAPAPTGSGGGIDLGSFLTQLQEMSRPILGMPPPTGAAGALSWAFHPAMMQMMQTQKPMGGPGADGAAGGKGGAGVKGGKFHAGGAVPEDMLAELLGGEHVFSPAEVAAAGGHGPLTALRGALFQEGGFLGALHQMGHDVGHFGSSAAHAAWNQVTGLLQSVRHPMGTLEGISRLLPAEALVGAESWSELGRAWKGLGKSVTHWDQWKTDPFGAAGATAVDLPLLVLGGKGLGKAGEAERLGMTPEKLKSIRGVGLDPRQFGGPRPPQQIIGPAGAAAPSEGWPLGGMAGPLAGRNFQWQFPLEATGKGFNPEDVWEHWLHDPMARKASWMGYPTWASELEELAPHRWEEWHELPEFDPMEWMNRQFGTAFEFYPKPELSDAVKDMIQQSMEDIVAEPDVNLYQTIWPPKEGLGLAYEPGYKGYSMDELEQMFGPGEFPPVLNEWLRKLYGEEWGPPSMGGEYPFENRLGGIRAFDQGGVTPIYVIPPYPKPFVAPYDLKSWTRALWPLGSHTNARGGVFGFQEGGVVGPDPEAGKSVWQKLVDWANPWSSYNRKELHDVLSEQSKKHSPVADWLHKHHVWGFAQGGIDLSDPGGWSELNRIMEWPYHGVRMPSAHELFPHGMSGTPMETVVGGWNWWNRQAKTIRRNMGLSFAEGGVTSLPESALIQPAQDGLVQWAERSTGGEAFIPLNGGARSRDIWALTGRKLGMYADGAMTSPALSYGRPPSPGEQIAAQMASATPRRPVEDTAAALRHGESTTIVNNMSGVMGRNEIDATVNASLISASRQTATVGGAPHYALA